MQVREERAVAVLLVDVLDASGSFLSRVRDLVGKNPVFLVGTKVCSHTEQCRYIGSPSCSLPSLPWSLLEDTGHVRRASSQRILHL